MKHLHLRFSALTGAALLLAAVQLPARAQDPDDLKRGVGRISLMNGQVSVQRGDSGDWVAGVVNAPLIAGDRVATGPNSRAEIQFDSSNMFRMGANAEVHLTQLEAARYQMEFAKGILTFRVLRPGDVSVEVDTPSVSVRPSRVGTYRVSVNDSGETEVTARAGSVEVFSPRGSQWVNSGQTLIARGDPSDPEYQIVAAVGYDEWDRWNDTRDRALMQSTSPQYVGQGVSGAEDLDQYGSWVNVDGYGTVWRPTEPVDWAPYQYGRWVWIDWYGWTWVSYDPWGWAPYHYGRWFYQANYGWLWYPGARGMRSYWSPGMVAFFGFGAGGFNLGFGFGFGNVGWVPLAPFEVFHPWWGRGYYGGFNRNINITNVNIASVYRNARVAHGVSSIGAEDFRNGRFGNISHPTGEQLRTAGLIQGQVGIAPSRSNLQYASHAAAFTPRTSGSTRFFTHQQPAAAQRMPFSQQQRAMEQGSRTSGAVPAGRLGGGIANDRPAAAGRLGGTANDRPAMSAGQGSQSAAGNRANGSAAASSGNSGGFRRFGDPGAQSGGAAPNAAQRSESGWRGSQSSAPQNTRPSQPQSQPGGGYRRFGSPGNSPGSGTPQYSAPQNRSTPPSYSQPSYSAPSRGSAPSYSAPSRGSAPSSSAPARGSGGGSGSGGSAGRHR
jgi:hypothetical protein